VRVISFEWFKQNCKHVRVFWDFEKTGCAYDHGNRELLTIDPATKEKYLYNPCKEKYCPVLNECKIYKKTGGVETMTKET